MSSIISSRFGVPLFESGRGPEIAGDWNFGIDCARSELVTICHQDDLFEPDYLETALRCVNRAKDPLILFTGYRELRNNIVSNNTNLLIKKALLLPMWILISTGVKWIRYWILRFGDPICCPTVLYFKQRRLPLPLFQSGLKSDPNWEAWELLSRTHGTLQNIHERFRDAENHR